MLGYGCTSNAPTSHMESRGKPRWSVVSGSPSASERTLSEPPVFSSYSMTSSTAAANASTRPSTSSPAANFFLFAVRNSPNQSAAFFGLYLAITNLVEIGLEIKAKSPFKHTFTIELANGSYGYLPPPNQHKLGGYETWLGTCILEEQASVKITKVLLELLAEEFRQIGELLQRESPTSLGQL